jgi:cytochrome c oxidase subunit 5a
MLKATAGRMLTLFKGSLGLTRPMTVGAVRHSSHSTETDEQFDARYEAYFNR